MLEIIISRYNCIIISIFYCKIAILPLSGPDTTPRDRHTDRARKRCHIAPPSSVREEAPRSTSHVHVTRGKPHCKRIHARIARRHRTLVLEQHIHFSYHGGHNHTTGPVIHQTTAPTHRVRHAVAQPSEEELCTFAHASHQIGPEGEKGDILVRARLGIKSLLPSAASTKRSSTHLPVFVEAQESTLKTSTATC